MNACESGVDLSESKSSCRRNLQYMNDNRCKQLSIRRHLVSPQCNRSTVAALLGVPRLEAASLYFWPQLPPSARTIVFRKRMSLDFYLSHAYLRSPVRYFKSHFIPILTIPSDHFNKRFPLARRPCTVHSQSITGTTSDITPAVLIVQYKTVRREINKADSLW